MKYTATTQNIAWFRDRYLDDALELKPPFQRKPVWSNKQKQYLIESVLLELPIPEIYLQTEIDEDQKVKHFVVDGQQRIRTLLQFLGVDTTAGEQESNRFVLDKLDATSRFRSKAFLDLTKEEQAGLLKYQFTVRQLEGATDDDVRDIFKRFNKYVTKLNDQEIRNASYTGPFLHLASKLADDDYWVQNGLVSPAQIRRMKDIEFVSELLIGTLHGPQGGSPKSIDEYYSQYEEYDDEFPSQAIAEKRFDKTLGYVRKIFDAGVESRFRSNRTDFYTLFVALTVLLIDHSLAAGEIKKLRASVIRFGLDVDKRVADESATASQAVAAYARAVEKGANDKKRRADRHAALTQILRKHVKAS